ncbi:MAG: AAA family ATPase [Vampirovibrio sp.]|nr:AAA family ATPase [Vampirovibrio sp.]
MLLTPSKTQMSPTPGFYSPVKNRSPILSPYRLATTQRYTADSSTNDASYQSGSYAYPPINRQPLIPTHTHITSSYTSARPSLSPQSFSPNRQIGYGSVDNLIQAGQLDRVIISVDPNSLTSLPKATLYLKDNSVRKILLPRNMAPFTQMLEDAQVGLQFQAETPHQSVGKMVGGMLEELFVPLILLSLTGLGAIGAMQFIKKHQGAKEIDDALQRAHKTFDEPVDYEQVVQYLDPELKDAFNSFINHEIDVMVMKGLPGVGKTEVASALANKVSHDNKDLMVLNIGSSLNGEAVRNLVEEIYSGDKVKTQQAMKRLTRLNGGNSVKELVLYTDEVERVTNSQLETIILNAVGNPNGHTSNTPKLRLIATCNKTPGWLKNTAVASRSEPLYFIPYDSDTTSQIFMDLLMDKLDVSHLDKAVLTETVKQVFQQNPGYSIRTVATRILPKVVNNLQATGKSELTDVRQQLAEALEGRPLSTTEVAYLIVKNIDEHIQHSDAPLPEKARSMLWSKSSHLAESTMSDADIMARTNGKQYDAAIKKLLAKQKTNFQQNPEALTTAIQNIGAGLKTRWMQTAMAEPEATSSATENNNVENKPSDATGQLKAEFVSYLEDLRAQSVKQEGGVNSQEYDAISRLIEILQTASEDSTVGKHLKAAAEAAQSLRSLDTDEGAYLDDYKLKAVFNAAVTATDETHTADNYYNVYPDAAYKTMFFALRQVVEIAAEEKTAST